MKLLQNPCCGTPSNFTSKVERILTVALPSCHPKKTLGSKRRAGLAMLNLCIVSRDQRVVSLRAGIKQEYMFGSEGSLSKTRVTLTNQRTQQKIFFVFESCLDLLVSHDLQFKTLTHLPFINSLYFHTYLWCNRLHAHLAYQICC